MKTTGCVLDWRGGTRDWSRYHHTLTEHNTIPVRGVNGEVRRFDGATSYIDCGNHASLNITDAITIEALMKSNSNTDIQRILFQLNGYSLTIDDTKILRIYIYIDGAWRSSTTKSFPDENLNKWVHIVSTYSSTSKIINFYVDGIAIAPVTLSGLNTYEIGPYSGNFYIGRPITNFFNGTIDNVIISSTAKSAAQAAADCYEVVCN